MEVCNRIADEDGADLLAYGEYILASDVLGVSMLVDALNHSAPGCTENTSWPFYVPDAPLRKWVKKLCSTARAISVLSQAA